MRLAEDQISSGVQDLSVVTPAGTNVNERAYHIVQLICVAVQLLTWAVAEDKGELVGLSLWLCTVSSLSLSPSLSLSLSLSLSVRDRVSPPSSFHSAYNTHAKVQCSSHSTPSGHTRGISAWHCPCVRVFAPKVMYKTQYLSLSPPGNSFTSSKAFWCAEVRL